MYGFAADGASQPSQGVRNFRPCIILIPIKKAVFALFGGKKRGQSLPFFLIYLVLLILIQHRLSCILVFIQKAL